MSLLPHKGALAIAAVIDIALNARGRPVAAKALATRHPPAATASRAGAAGTGAPLHFLREREGRAAVTSLRESNAASPPTISYAHPARPKR